MAVFGLFRHILTVNILTVIILTAISIFLMLPNTGRFQLLFIVSVIPPLFIDFGKMDL